MALELNITAEDIDQLVKDSIMKAGFGKAVETAIKNAIGGYSNPVENEVKKYVGEVCAKLLREKFSAEIHAAVVVAIEAKVNNELIQKTTDAAIERMVRASEDRY